MTSTGRNWIGFAVFVLVFVIPFGAGGTDEHARTMIQGVQHYQEGRYDEAIKAFQKIADAGVRNGKLFYNLGNAHLKMDRLGYALLWYERALKIIPDDPDLKFNYRYALLLTQDERAGHTEPIFKVLFFWKHLLSAETIRWTAVLLNALFWSILIIRVVLRKRRLQWVNSILLVLAVVFTATAFYNYFEAHHVRQAVILQEAVAVRSGLTEDSTQLFVLHAGTKVRIEKQHKNHYRIHYSEDKIGWIKKGDAGVI
jgi:tetratricopeptide (TPR) repeat protein